MAMSSSLAGAGVAGAVVAALAAAVLGSGAGLEPALGMPARKRNINFFFSSDSDFRRRVAEQFWPVRYQQLCMPPRTFHFLFFLEEREVPLVSLQEHRTF
jgi:hypothetical protein